MVILIVLAVLLIITASITCFYAKRTFGRGGRIYDLSSVLKDKPELLRRIDEGKRVLENMTFERHTVISFDGLRLVGKLYRAPKATNKFIISLHGYRSSSEDFVCAMPFFMEQGYNILAVEQRAHGESEGKWITFGIKERYDALSWANYVVNKFGPDATVVLDGLSMGATTVLMAAELDLPKNVKGIIADCGFTSPWDIVTEVARRDMHIPKFPLLYLMLPTVRLLCGFGLRDSSTVTAIRKSDLPILFVHGVADDFVPHEMSVHAYKSRPENSRLVSVEGATHGTSYVVDEENCKKELAYFLNEAVEKGRF